MTDINKQMRGHVQPVCLCVPCWWECGLSYLLKGRSCSLQMLGHLQCRLYWPANQFFNSLLDILNSQINFLHGCVSTQAEAYGTRGMEGAHTRRLKNTCKTENISSSSALHWQHSCPRLSFTSHLLSWYSFRQEMPNLNTINPRSLKTCNIHTQHGKKIK